MNKPIIWVAIFAIIFILYVIYYYYFSIYETKSNLRLIKQEEGINCYKIELIPLNALGKKVNYRVIEFGIKIVDGYENVVSYDEKKKVICVKINKGNKVTININSKYSLADEILTIVN